MENQNHKWLNRFVTAISYILVAAASCVITIVLILPKLKYYNSYLPLATPQGQLALQAQKLEELLNIIDTGFIGEAELTTLGDAAAEAMVSATGDRWSYYISADQMESFNDQKDNAYVGIGITISTEDSSNGFLITRVEPDSSAQKAGILPGDILVEAQGQSLLGKDSSVASGLIRGEVGTQVSVAVLRQGEKRNFTMERVKITSKVASGQMLPGNVGYVAIGNFNERCAAETIETINVLIGQGATKLLFDVRNNGGGYKHELVKVLDYLLPQGELFRSLDYTGAETVDTSDGACINLPMAVLINAHSYSAAEFFAAALEEYDWATTVGERTVGKGYFQVTIPLADGSAVALSTGKYFTPKGVSLAEVGGLVPNVEVQVDAQTQALIYAGVLPLEEDPQVQAALNALNAE